MQESYEMDRFFRACLCCFHYWTNHCLLYSRRLVLALIVTIVRKINIYNKKKRKKCYKIERRRRIRNTFLSDGELADDAVDDDDDEDEDEEDEEDAD